MLAEFLTEPFIFPAPPSLFTIDKPMPAMLTNMAFWFWLTAYFDHSNTHKKENETGRFEGLS